MQENVLPVSSSEVVGIMLSDVQPAGSCWLPSGKPLAGQTSTVVHTALQAFCTSATSHGVHVTCRQTSIAMHSATKATHACFAGATGCHTHVANSCCTLCNTSMPNEAPVHS